ncbi:cytochrome p450, partial [Rhizoctonia solani]
MYSPKMNRGSEAYQATSFNQFEKGEKFHDMLEGFLGTGIFNSDGETWKLHRSMARPFFDRERVVNQSHFERHTGRLKSLLGVLSDKDDSSFDIQVGRYTLDFTMGWFIIINDPNIALTYEHLYVAFLFGLDSRTMVPPHSITKESEKLMFAFDTLRKAASTRIRMMKDSRRTVDAYIMPIVNEAIERNQSIAQGDDDATRTFLEYLVTVSNDPKLIRDTLVSFLLAGRDTSASLLTFTIYVLALYPDTYDQLSKEINSIVNDDRPCTFEEIKSMRYLRALINETLRVFPPVPFNIRRSKNLPSILPSSLSRAQNGLRKDIWGDDAEEFKPGRWLAEDPQKVHITNPFAFIPFNGGPRMCLGQNLAYLLVSHTIVELQSRLSTGVESQAEKEKSNAGLNRP